MALTESARRPWFIAGALCFAAATIAYSAVWMYYIRWQPETWLGATAARSSFTGDYLITSVTPNSPAERAGLKKGDILLGINNTGVRSYPQEDVLLSLNQSSSNTLNPFAAVMRGHPGDRVSFLVQRKGSDRPELFSATLAPYRAQPIAPTLGARIAIQFLVSYPLPFLIVGLAVLFLRLEDRNAWLLAALFAGFIASAPLANLEPRMHPALRGFGLSYMVLFYGMMPSIFYYFFSTFPAPSPLDRRIPWLKFVLLFGGLVCVLPLSIWVLISNDSHPLWLLLVKMRNSRLVPAARAYGLLPFLLGMCSLLWNSVRRDTPDVRRKSRVLVWGIIVGFTPVLLLPFTALWMHREFFELPFWFYALPILALFLIPLTFAYAVIKHRVLEIPVLLRRSARYVLVRRGFAFLVIVLAAGTNVIFTVTAMKLFRAQPALATSLGVGFGITLALVSAPALKRSTDRIDRAFFRGAYDARMILEDLAEKARIVTSREQLTSLLPLYLEQALHPSQLFVYLVQDDGLLHVQMGSTHDALPCLPADAPSLLKLASDGAVREVWESNDEAGLLRLLGPLQPECVVPIQGRVGGLLGLLVLGGRLSEEPYSTEDKRLLASVASQAGVALENIALAQEMAARIESERRARQEMEIAREVQRRLLPQDMPGLATLDYAGQCIQARAVGGDYFDFLDLAPGRVGFVVADISGKGISGALLMANLQANLRSQYAVALQDLPRLLRSVNRLFYKNTEENRYATLFFGAYDDRTRLLQYVNCGHNAPLLLRSGGGVERLCSTATVLGLFEGWDCSMAEASLESGDILIVYTDGISEAENERGEEFGEARLLQTVRAAHGHEPRGMMKAVSDAVLQFSAGEQADDLTLVIAHGR